MSDMASRLTPADRYQRLMDWPLVCVALLFLAAYAWPIIDPTLPQQTKNWLMVAENLSWAVFVADYFLRFALAEGKIGFVRKNLVDLVLIALPVVRSLRALQLVKLVRVFNHRASVSLHGQVAQYMVFATLLIAFLGALAVLDAERPHPESTLKDFPDALWWAIVTISTVGYGDHYPVTATGRIIAAGLMLSGIGLLGVVTATVSSALIQRVQEIEDSAQVATHRDLECMRAELVRLEELLKQLHLGHCSDAVPSPGGVVAACPTVGEGKPCGSQTVTVEDSAVAASPPSTNRGGSG